MHPLAFVTLLLVTFAAGCTTKPSIPDDLMPVCYHGQLGAVSEKAQEGILWSIQCGGKDV